MLKLTQALDKVQSALMAGAFDQLQDLSAEIERLMETVEIRTEQDAALIRQKASRNAACLGAAMQGVRAAQRRLTDLREASTGHRTYGPLGQRSAIATGPSSLRQRV
jgi:hypothetical protein